MTNTIYNGRTTCVYNDTNDVPESIYRRPHVKLFRKIGEKVVDNISGKVKTLDGLFEMVGLVTGKFTAITDRIVDGVALLIEKLFKGKEDKNE